MRVLYISYDGMTDPLGQSQVLPYLTELNQSGVEYHVISAEKSDNYHQNKATVSKLMEDQGIHWHPLPYTKKPPVFSTIKDIQRIRKSAASLHKQYKFDLCHCRSYIAAFAGLHLKKKHKLPFLFDMRGFYPDERVDGEIWKLNNPVFKMVYGYFKRMERAFLSEADHVISLTDAGKDIMAEEDSWNVSADEISVIPCSADLQHFSRDNLNPEMVKKIRLDTGLKQDDFVLSYLGSLGTWYMTGEMLDFYAELLREKPNAKFLIISRDDPEIMLKPARERGISTENIIIKPASRQEVPALISLSSVSIFFIKPVFSKKASSPTKLAEVLGMGIPVICNAGVGDVDSIVGGNNAGLVIEKMQAQHYRDAIIKLDDLLQTNPEKLRQLATNLFSLEKACKTYRTVYNHMVQ
jgi:glycosyltransferase involved in cell wall biosynthesis